LKINPDNSKDFGNLFELLTVNYENLIRIPDFSKDDSLEYTKYGTESKLDGVIDALLTGNKEKIISGDFDDIILFEDDCTPLWNMSRPALVRQKLAEDIAYYVFFRAFVDGELHYYNIKYVKDSQDASSTGVVIAIIDDGVFEKEKRLQGQDLYQAFNDSKSIIAKKTAELRERTIALSFANNEAIDLLGNVVEFRNNESGLHIKRVKVFTRVLAEQVLKDCPEYNLTPEIVDNIVSASPLHDVGKIKVSDSILLKRGKLTPDEILEMQRHCEYGLDILRGAPKSWTSQYKKTVMDICTCHHEKWDGKGYPNGLRGDEIPISAQIVSVADCYDALATVRVYKPAYSPEESFNMIMNGECGAFSEKLLACFAKCKEKFAKIVESPELYREKALVQLSGENKLKGLNLLLVDDNDMSLDINCEILEHDGAFVTTAENGRDAIEKFVKDGPFDAVIMDLVMPVMSGVEATKKIREIETNLGSTRVPIIAISAESVDQTSLFEAGMDASMAKPLVIGELTRILISCMHNSSMQMQRQLEETLKIANTDALTKVKNVAAYIDMRASLNSEIKENNDLEFAIVMCDINDLKSANDNYGHETGDIYIKNCSKILCDVFSRSPVYRVGGDEFVTLLRGKDYEERAEKLELLNEMIVKAEQKKNYTEGYASFAVGFADYNRKIDFEVEDVQARADASMYSDKKGRREAKANANN